MTGIPSADQGIAWVRNVPAGITGLDRLNTFQLVKDGLQAPETASPQCGNLAIGHVNHYIGCWSW